MMESMNRNSYREAVKTLGKKEFTLLKMQEYGFWPDNLKTPYERQEDETEEDFKKRKKLLEKYQSVIDRIANLYDEKEKINAKLNELRSKYDDTWDYEKIRKDIAKNLMEESIKRRQERKLQKELERKQKSDAWQRKKTENIVFIGRGYSSRLKYKENNEETLKNYNLPIINDDKDLAEFLGIEYKKLRYLTYHRDVITFDNYTRFEVPKKKGGVRTIAAPKKTLKMSQRKILYDILCKIQPEASAHGFIREKSIITGAISHTSAPELLINIDLEDFFGTITFNRVRGMFEKLGYSGYISSLLSMICTYCERMPIEVKGETKYVKSSERILPQGAPSSPMITNIICRKLDKRLSSLASKYNLEYSRYADDMSFSFKSVNESYKVLLKDFEDKYSNKGDVLAEKDFISKIIGIISKIIREEGFTINNSKTRYLRKNNCQSITGIVINNKDIGVPKKWVKNLRAAIYNASKEKANNGTLSQDKINEIKGMICWLKSVNKEKYSKIISDGEKLINY